MVSNTVPASALRASVFLMTRMYTPCARALARRSVICVTVSPRYSAATTDWAFAATAFTSATSAFLSSRFSGIHFSWPEDHSFNSELRQQPYGLQRTSTLDGDLHGRRQTLLDRVRRTICAGSRLRNRCRHRKP